MAQVTTLEGLRTRRLSRSSRRCDDVVEVPFKSLDGDIMRICGDDLTKDGIRVGNLIGADVTPSEIPAEPVKRRRGRPKLPKGVKGKKPKMKVRLPSDASATERKIQCMLGDVKWVKVRRFKNKPFFGSKADRSATEYRCRCGMDGNKNYIPNSVCEAHAGPKPK